MDAIDTSIYINIEKNKKKIYLDYLEILDTLEFGKLPNIKCLIKDLSLIYYLKLSNYVYQEINIPITPNSKKIIMYIGGGISANDIVTDSNRKEVNNITGEYKVIVNEPGEKIFFIIPLDKTINNVIMGGFPMPLIKIIDSEYNIYVSVSKFNEGIYTIQVNE